MGKARCFAAAAAGSSRIVFRLWKESKRSSILEPKVGAEPVFQPSVLTLVSRSFHIKSIPSMCPAGPVAPGFASNTIKHSPFALLASLPRPLHE